MDDSKRIAESTIPVAVGVPPIDRYGEMTIPAYSMFLPLNPVDYFNRNCNQFQ